MERMSVFSFKKIKMKREKKDRSFDGWIMVGKEWEKRMVVNALNRLHLFHNISNIQNFGMRDHVIEIGSKYLIRDLKLARFSNRRSSFSSSSSSSYSWI